MGAYLAIDLGAESGRAVLGEYAGEQLRVREIHRFSNRPVEVAGSLRWDAYELFAGIKASLRLAAGATGGKLQSVGVATWGVDFGLLDAAGALIELPYHYRDRRTEGMMARAFERVPREVIYQRTGIQFLPFNTLYQLLAMQGSPSLARAATLLTMPDLFNYWLCGRVAAEYTIASTTQCLDVRARDWDRDLLAGLGLPAHIFPPLVAPGTPLGRLRPELARETGLEAVMVVAPACHDTASAVAAVPFTSERALYISSGTWSLVGAEVPEPVVDGQTLAHGFTNEAGVGGAIRLLKNVMGLWLLQECRRVWAEAGRTLGYGELAALAEAVPPSPAVINPDDERFLAPGDMPARILAYCAEHDLPAPQGEGQMARLILDSLAARYAWVVDRLSEVLGWQAEALHVIGGGAQNALLCRLTAQATGLPVLAGPFEATAIGNLLVQMLAASELDSLAAGRALVARSFPVERYGPDAPHLRSRASSAALRSNPPP